MIKLSEKSRKVLRRIYQGLGAATISLLFQACYGMPIDEPVMYGPGPDHEDDVSFHGLVYSAKNTTIPGIKVSVKDLNPYVFTDYKGTFTIIVPKQDLYLLQFEDIDGPKNGSYKNGEKMVLLSDRNTPLNVKLDEADEE
jgi:putative lipoprotein (rSAM/lipoprotein system)